MELGKLKSAIRSRKGNPAVMVNLSGHTVAVTVQKTSIMEALDELFKTRNTETGLIMDDEGRLISDTHCAHTTAHVNPEQTSSDDLDDLDDLSVDDDLPAEVGTIDDLHDL
jgi:hypothetical protein